MPGCKVVWNDGLRFTHTSGSGHALVTDAPEDAGGADTAASPMELVLHALAGCAGVDLILILDKMKQPLASLEISVDADRADEHPRVYTAIRLHAVLDGDLDPRKVERAMELSLGTYCSVAGMLRSTAEITPTWEIRAAS